MKKITLGLALITMLPMASQAQRYLGISTSNWSGNNGTYLNPANLADNRHKFSVDLFSLNAGIDNNFTSVSIGDLSTFLQEEDKDLGKLLSFSKQDKYTLAGPNAEVRGPGFMTSIGRKHGIALTTRVRLMTQAHNIDSRLFQNVLDSSVMNSTLEAASSNGISVKSEAFNVTIHSWAEIGLSYGGVIWENEKHLFKGGATVRYLAGAGYLSLVNKNLDLQYYDGTDSVVIRNTDLAYGSNMKTNGFNNFDLNDFMEGTGSGFGADLGFVYEFRPKSSDYKYDMDGKTGISDNSKNKYLLRVSAAVTDLGSITYKQNNTTVNFRNKSSQTEGYIRGLEIASELANFDSLKNYLGSRGFFADTSNNGKAKVVLPTSLNINVDYHIWKGFYANAMYIGNLANRGKFGNSIYGQFTITPRYDTRIFSIGVPLTYNTLSSTMGAGLGVRAGGFFMGSDNLLSFGKQYGVNFYFGASVPLNKKKPNDSDGDLVSNRKDRCKNEKGVLEMQGCPNPDKDGDGILDKDDKCPDIAGSKTAAGCPDADLDGVADAEDRCAEEAGNAAMQGCPDRDNDHIADIDDTCPDQAGLPQFKGCPDTDNDGLADNNDLCPNAVGSIANKGCPDSDNDGLTDNEDKCPTVAGTLNNNGCPEVSVEVKKRLAFAATAIQFDAGKASIKKASNKLLDEIVTILNNYPDYYMAIEGHTDNSGNAAKNLQLSKERAEAVKNYFITNGISADRLESNGFGDTMPAESNKTAAGRAKNRRVAMDLKLKD